MKHRPDSTYFIMQNQSAHMTYFLEEVASYLMNKNQGDFLHTIIVFPNQRARLFFNNHLAKLTEKPVWSPEYYTINDFILKLSGLQLADQLTMLFRLFKVFKEVSGSGESFDSFYYYCEIMLADFDDIDKYRVNADLIFSNLSDIREMDDVRGYLDEFQVKSIERFWNICLNSKQSPEKQKFLNLWILLFKIYTKFADELKKEGLAYEGMAYRIAVDSIDTAIHGWLAGKQIAFVGFNALNRSEEIIFEQLMKQGKALFFWDYSPYYIDNELHEAGFFLRRYIRKYPQPADYSPVNDFSSHPNITTIAVPANISQAKLIDYCLAKMKSLPVVSHAQNAIILADEGLLLPVINSLPPSIEKINISMGYPVIETPAFTFINALVDLHRNKKFKNESQTEHVFYHADLFNLLHHGFLNDIAAIEGVRLFEKRCRQNNRIFIDTDELISQHQLLKLIFEQTPMPLTFGSYLRDIIEAIALMILDNDSRAAESSLHVEVLYSIHRLLTQFDAQLRESGLNLQLQTILNLLRKIIRGVRVPFTGEPLEGLQIMGILETRTLDFENLIVLSMNEGKFPKTGHSPSFIPFSLREGFGLPTIIHQDSIFAYYFYRLLHRSRNVIMVYNTRSEGLQKGEPSRYILQLRYEYEVPLHHLDMSYKILPFNRIPITGIHSKIVEDKLKKYLRPGGKSFLSPSAVNTYLKCKLRFFYKYIEEINEPENVEEQVEINVFGSILHKAMAILYHDFIGKEIGRNDIESILKDEQLIERAIHRSFGEEYFNREYIEKTDFQGRNLIIKSIIQKYVKGILEFDIRNNPFRIVSLEDQVRFEISVNPKQDKIALGGIIDRLDEIGGSMRVIDYKTGEKKNLFKSVEALFSDENKLRNDAVFQTFLYSYMLEKNTNYDSIRPTLFFVREVLRPEFDLLIFQTEKRQRIAIQNFKPYSDEFEAHLKIVLAEIFDPAVAFGQTTETEQCKYCPYNEICRVNQ